MWAQSSPGIWGNHEPLWAAGWRMGLSASRWRADLGDWLRLSSCWRRSGARFRPPDTRWLRQSIRTDPIVPRPARTIATTRTQGSGKRCAYNGRPEALDGARRCSTDTTQPVPSSARRPFGWWSAHPRCERIGSAPCDLGLGLWPYAKSLS